MVQELHRAETLGIRHVVAHPGAFTSGTEAGGLDRIVEALDEIDQQTRSLGVGCLLETTAGQGTALGWRFEHLAAILGRVQNPDRLGVCFDTCHVFAAGYPLATLRDYRATMASSTRSSAPGRFVPFTSTTVSASWAHGSIDTPTSDWDTSGWKASAPSSRIRGFGKCQCTWRRRRG